MRVPQRTDHALRALTLLAEKPAGSVVPAGELAVTLSLPRRFVEQQLADLARANIVVSVRGARGGYRLSRAASAINVAEVVAALQGDILDIPRTTSSAVSEMWATAAGALEDALSSVTLQQLADRQRELESERSVMYYI